jgi:transcriptional regulator with XRE-family HTH domain
LSIGAALAQAREGSGLTVAQVSQRTRIRETIIRDIERDDFSSCGGDFYARGHVRAIARVVGLDPAQLIAEYDAARTPEPPEPPVQPEPRRRRDEWDTFSAPQADPAPQPRYQPPGITAAEAFRPAMPLALGETRRRRPNWTLGLLVLLLAAVAVLGYHLASSAGKPRLTASGHHGTSQHGHKSTPPPTSTPSPSPSASSTSVPLAPASAVAFGPGGIGQGDNPGMASLALGGNGSTGWQTDWYATPTFAGLQSGTGLLLNMGKSVTISSIQLTLASEPGATVQLRVGDTPALADLSEVDQTSNAAGTLRLSPTTPTSGQYVLIWFTRLPADSSGTYQETVSHVSVAGTS